MIMMYIVKATDRFTTLRRPACANCASSNGLNRVTVGKLYRLAGVQIRRKPQLLISTPQLYIFGTAERVPTRCSGGNSSTDWPRHRLERTRGTHDSRGPDDRFRRNVSALTADFSGHGIRLTAKGF